MEEGRLVGLLDVGDVFVGDAVTGLTVGDLVGLLVGALVGLLVGALVGLLVGALDGLLVGALDGDGVGSIGTNSWQILHDLVQAFLMFILA